MNPVVIVGAGLSGLSAGVALAAQRIPVVVLEQKAREGGRAFSFHDAATNTEVDNGQHVLIAGYTGTFTLLRTIGSLSLLDVQPLPRLVIHHPERGLRTLVLPPLPSPAHLLLGVLASNFFSGPGKREIVRAGASLLRVRPETLREMTVEAWLDRVGQSRETREMFWEPLAVAMMNERTSAAAASVFVRSMRTAFLGGWRNAALAVPRVGLSRLFAEPACRFITDHGGSVRRSSRVVATVTREGAAASVVLGDGRRVECSALVLAVPASVLPTVAPPEVSKTPALQAAASFPMSPIVSIHLWFGHEWMPRPMVGVVGKTIEWIFRKNGYVSAVISAAHGPAAWTNERLTAVAVDDLRSVFGCRIGPPLRSLVIRERRATVSLTPAVETARPDARTPLPNLFLAGDWTATGLPATIEGAVTSGMRAAALAGQALQRAVRTRGKG